MKYKIELNYPLDPNVESGLFSRDIFVVSGEYGDNVIVVETKIPIEQSIRPYDVDIKSVLCDL